MSDLVPTIRRPLDYRTHWAMTGGWQTITLCGKRGNWLHSMQKDDPGIGIINCSECLEEWRSDKQEELHGKQQDTPQDGGGTAPQDGG